MSSRQVTLILVSTLSRVKRVFMSIRACLVSLYTVPRKLRGRESWKSRPFTITRSPTVIVPTRQQQNNLQRCTLSSSIVSYVHLWIQERKKNSTFKLWEQMKHVIARIYLHPLWFHFLHQGYFISYSCHFFMLAVLCFHLVSIIQFSLGFTCHFHLSIWLCLEVFFSFLISKFTPPLCAVDTNHGHGEVNSVGVIGNLYLYTWMPSNFFHAVFPLLQESLPKIMLNIHLSLHFEILLLNYRFVSTYYSFRSPCYMFLLLPVQKSLTM